MILERETSRESVVLAHLRSSLDDVLTNAAISLNGGERVAMSLLDRLPTRTAPGRDALTRALFAIEAAAGGFVAVSFDDRDRAER